MDWRGSDLDDNEAKSKTENLLDVLKDEDIGRQDLVEQLSDYYNIS